MNDTSGILPSIVDSLLDNLALWDSNPEVVLCSNMLPSLGANAGHATRDEQDGRDMAAGITRTIAKYRGIGLLDMHRTFCAARDGFDPCRSTITSTEIAAVVSGSHSQCPQETIDFAVEFTLDLDDFVAGTTVVVVRIGSMDLDWLRIAKTSGDRMQFQLSSGPSSTPFNYKVVSDADWPGTGSMDFRVEVKNNIITFYRLDVGGTGGTYSQPIFTSKIVRGGFFFQPDLYMPGGGSPIFSDVSFYISRPRLYMPTIRDRDLFDGGDGAGSFYNHAGNYISAHIYGPTIEAACFGPNYRAAETLTLDSGTWTPVATSVANLDSTPTIGTASYARIGDQVFGSFRANVDPTAASTMSSFRVTLPVASAFNSGDDASGTIGARNINQSGAVSADATNDELLVEFPSAGTSAANIQVMFRYTVK